VGPGPDARRGVASAAAYDGGVRATWVVSVATAFVLLGASILAFLNPVWVGFEQNRSGVREEVVLQSLPPIVPGAFGVDCASGDVARITDSILHDLVLGGAFDIRFGPDVSCPTASGVAPGATVLSDAERSHMGDVRGVFAGFAMLVLASIGWLAVTWRRSGTGDRARWWRAVRNGSVGLAFVVAVIGAISLVAFDAAFELFHRLFFAAGSYDFDPATSHLIQLFPDQFWSDTTLALGVFAVVVAGLVAVVATRRASGLEAARPSVTAAAIHLGKVTR
jgi:hypothetical protein